MSSSDQVRLSYIKQDKATPNVIPATGNFRVARILSDSLDGTPNVIQDDESGSGDRMGSGQSVVGLDVGGSANIKLSPDPFHDDMLEAAVMDKWSSPVAEAATDFDSATGVLTGTGFNNFAVGDLVVISGSAADSNNVPMYVVAIASATSMTVISPDGVVDETGATLTVTRPAYVQVSNDKEVFFFAKDFLDLTNKSISYYGNSLSGFELNFTFKQHITGSYTFSGTNWDAPTTPATDGRTVTPIGPEALLNASQDMGLVVLDGAKVDFCIQGLKISLDNGLDADECIGSKAAKEHSLGEAAVTVGMEAYLADTNFDLVRDRMDQVPVEILYYTRNANGLGYGFHLPAVRLAFPDPANGGKNTKAMLNMSGTASKGGTMENLIRVYKF